MSRRLFFLFISLCIYAGLPAQIMDSIPFELGADSRIYVKCTVNDSDTLRFLFDTGASDMVINTASPRFGFDMSFDGVAENSGASGSNSVQSSSNNVFRAGNAVADSMLFIAIAYPPDAWDGVMGLSFMKRYSVQVDYDSRMIYLYRPGSSLPVAADAIALEMEYRLNVPVVPVCVHMGGRSYSLNVEIDTGSDRALDINSPFVEKHGFLSSHKPFAVSTIAGSDGNSGVLYNVFFDRLVLGSLAMPRFPGALSTVKEGVQASDAFDGVMGNNLLQRFNMFIDFSGGMIYLQPNNLFYKPFYDFLVR